MAFCKLEKDLKTPKIKIYCFGARSISRYGPSPIWPNNMHRLEDGQSKITAISADQFDADVPLLLESNNFCEI